MVFDDTKIIRGFKTGLYITKNNGEITPLKPDKKTIKFNETREQIRDEIIRIFAIPPVFLGGKNRKRKSKKVVAK